MPPNPMPRPVTEKELFAWILDALESAQEWNAIVRKNDRQKNVVELVFADAVYFLKLEKKAFRYRSGDPFRSFGERIASLNVSALERIKGRRYPDASAARLDLYERLRARRERDESATGFFADNFLCANKIQREKWRQVLIEEILRAVLHGKRSFAFLVNSEIMLAALEFSVFLKEFVAPDLRLTCVYTWQHEVNVELLEEKIKLVKSANYRCARNQLLAECDTMMEITTHVLQTNCNYYMRAQMRGVGLRVITIDEAGQVETLQPSELSDSSNR